MSTAHGKSRYWEASPLTRRFQTFVTLTFAIKFHEWGISFSPTYCEPISFRVRLDFFGLAHGKSRYWEASPLTRRFQTFVNRPKNKEFVFIILRKLMSSMDTPSCSFFHLKNR